MFIAALFRIAKIWKQPKCPSIDEWVKKKWCIYMMDYDLAIKRNETLPSATTGMDLERVWCRVKSVRERQMPYDFTYIWNLKVKQR